MKSSPEPPVNVQLIYDDGRKVPVDTVYAGVDEEGLHVWQVVDPPDPTQIAELKIDQLPGRTSVEIMVPKGEKP